MKQIKRLMMFVLILVSNIGSYGMSSGNDAQKFTLKLHKVSLDSFITEIEKTSDYFFFLKDELVDEKVTITVDARDTSVEEVLERALAGTSISFHVKGRQVLLEKTNTKVEQSRAATKHKIKGVVVASDGEPIIGANIRLANDASVGTITNIDGAYELTVPNGTASLSVSYLGYNTEIVKVDNREVVNIIMQESSTEMEEVVVVGYGQQKKQGVVASVSTAKAKEISVPTRSLSHGLAGRVSGVVAMQRSGEPGYDDAEFWIRGISSFKGGTSPLVLVDGVPRAMNDIEVDEIETFSVLKDAAATAVYGAEGANGVVLITSKRGVTQRTKVTFRTEHSFSEPTRLPKFVNSADYLSLFNEALRNDGEPAQFSDETINNYRQGLDYDLYPSVDWFDTMLKKVTTNHRYSLNVRGGSDKVKYFVSGAFYNESGIFKGSPTKQYDTNIGLERYNLRSNIDVQLFKDTKLSVDMSGQYKVTNYPGTGTASIFRAMLITPPYTFPAVYSDGTVATYDQERDSNMKNPYNLLMNSGYAKEWHTAIQSAVSLDQGLDVITKGLSARTKIGFDFFNTFLSRRTYNPSRFHATGRDEDGNLIFKQVVSGEPDLKDPSVSNGTTTRKIYIEAAANYKRTFNALHDVGGMLLYMQKEDQNYGQSLPYRKQAVVGRVTYGFNDKYFLEASFGYTGSEAFASGHRFGFFPAVGAAYFVSNEGFYPEQLRKIINKLKLRASAGKTGNDNTSGERFLYRPTYNMGAGQFQQGWTESGASNILGNGITEARFAAPMLGWEEEVKQNYGFDLGLFDNRVELMVDYFRSTRDRILLQRQTVPQIGGFRDDPWQNFGKVDNQGIDLSLDLTHQIGDLTLSSKTTFTFARNKIVEMDELEPRHPWMKQTGHRIGDKNLYIAERLYTEDDFTVNTNTTGGKTYTLKSDMPQPTLGGLLGPGDIKYKDVNGDGVINNYDMVRGIGHPNTPEIVYGFGFSADYKGFYANVFFQGVGNSSVLFGGSTPEGWFPFSWGVDQSNYRQFALDRWTEDNPSQDVLMPRLHRNGTNNANNNVPSTWWLRNGGFLRFKDIQVGYSVPKTFLRKYKIESLNIYMKGYNLVVWDDIKYFDPETGNANAGNNYPLPRNYTVGLEFTF